jgi:hypothetical protein
MPQVSPLVGAEGGVALGQNERRARSSSPAKNRKPITTDFKDADNDMWSVKSSPIPNRIQNLSSSPRARKMLVTPSPGNSKYVIPIPLTLQLPPRLTQPSNDEVDRTMSPSPERTPTASRNTSPLRASETPTRRKPLRLVYTGTQYEKLDTSNDDDSGDDEAYEQQLQKQIRLPPRPAGFVRRLAPDELSVINETSEASSRRSTIKQGSSMPQPTRNHTPVSSDLTSSLASAATITRASPERLSFNDPAYETAIRSASNSLVSSFGSMGTSLNFSERRKITVNSRTTKQTRLTSGMSSASNGSASSGSVSSWKSGLEIVRGGPTVDGSTRALQPVAAVLSTLSLSDLDSNGNSTWVSGSDSSIATKPLQISHSVATMVSSETPPPPPLPPMIGRHVALSPSASKSAQSDNDAVENLIAGYYEDTLQSDSAIDDSVGTNSISDGSFNAGAGKSFSFPNSTANVTNSDVIRMRQLSQESSTHKSTGSRLFKSADGCIEIPDLDKLEAKSKDYDFDYGENASSYAPSRFSLAKSSTSSGLEPLGAPCAEALDYVKNNFGDIQSSDESSDFESYQMRRPAATTYDKSLPPVLSTAGVTQPRLARKLPPRHNRHKSMFNIDFMVETGAPKLATHSRSRSLPAVAQDLDAAALDIVVAEPPTPVQYPVDFKDHAELNDGLFHHTHYNLIDINRTLSKLTVSDGTSGTSKPISNQTLSNPLSYQSSDSAPSELTLASDADSVIIDLTEDKFEICTIQRNDTVLSYRSVTEKTQDGRPIDVVLVEDDEATERDLESLYSKYRNTWVKRSNSSASTASTLSSLASFESGASGKFAVKPIRRTPQAIRPINLKSAVRPVTRPQPARKYQSMRIHPPNQTKTETKTKPAPPLPMSRPLKNMPLTTAATTIQGKPLPSCPASNAPNRAPDNSFDYSSSYNFHTYIKSAQTK